MSRLAYTVIATLPSEGMLERYVAWLRGGHVGEVCRGGAVGAAIVRMDGPDGVWGVEVRYEFESREAFERYVAESAPRLRAEGMAMFGPETGAQFARTTGVILEDGFGIPV